MLAAAVALLLASTPAPAQVETRGARVSETAISVEGAEHWQHWTMPTHAVGWVDSLGAVAPHYFRQRFNVLDDFETYRRSIEEEREAWDKVIAHVAASEVYGRLELEPQIGLVPLRVDSFSGLWEFWHLASGERPQFDRRADRYALPMWFTDLGTLAFNDTSGYHAHHARAGPSPPSKTF